jgi:hypothetical protein
MQIDTSHLSAQLSWIEPALDAVVTKLPDVRPDAVTLINSIVAPAVSGTASLVLKVGELGTPATEAYLSRHIDSYAKLREETTVTSRARNLAKDLVPRVSDRFAAAERAYGAWCIGTGSQDAAAVHIRTLLDALKGEVLEEGRKLGQAQNLKWADSALLFPYPDVQDYQQPFAEQGNIRRDLVDELSAAAKGRRIVDLQPLWTESMQHTSAVLEMLSISRTNRRLRDAAAEVESNRQPESDAP